MGIFDKVAIAVGALAGAATIASEVLKNKEKKLRDLDMDFEEYSFEYKQKRAVLAEKASRGDKRAAKKLEELDHEFRMEKMEYEAERKKYLPKEKKDKAAKKAEDTTDKTITSSEESKPSVDKKDVEKKHCGCCGKGIAFDAKFCPYCGNKTEEADEELYCSNCGAEITSDSVFCSSCGHKIK